MKIWPFRAITYATRRCPFTNTTERLFRVRLGRWELRCQLSALQ
jgi:hypothetical protein